ncbi:MAG: MATE family efflux transporter [Peptostreptococcaceae bacterium]
MKNITEGSIRKSVIALFIPIALSSFFQQFYSFVDGIIVSYYLGDLAFSAVGGSSLKIITTLINFFVGVSSGICALVSRYFGSVETEKVEKTIFNGLFVFTIFGILISIFGVIFSKEILIAMNTPFETLDLSNTYLRVFMYGLVFSIIYNVLSGSLTAIGDSKTPFKVLVFCSFLNIFLNIFLVRNLGMGIFGVSFSTVLSQIVSVLILGIKLFKLFPNILKSKIDFDFIKEILKIGLPSGAQSMMYSFSNIFIQSTINTFGYLNVASWSAYIKLDSIVSIFVSSLGNTVMPFVGQNFGTKNIDRIKESVNEIMKLSYMISLTLISFIMIFRIELLGLFSKDVNVINTGANLVFLIMPMYLLSIPQTMYSQALRGIGKTFMPMILTLVGVIGIRFFWILFLLPYKNSIYFLALCYPISAFIMSVVFFIYYKKEINRIKF